MRPPTAAILLAMTPSSTASLELAQCAEEQLDRAEPDNERDPRATCRSPR